MDLGVMLAIFIGGMAAGFVNTVAGGGSLITVPLLIFVGLPPGVANGTSRIAILAQNVAAAARYQRLGAVDWPAARRFAPAMLSGALAGSVASARLSDPAFETMLAWVTLFAALPVAIDFGALLERAGFRWRGPAPAWVAQLALFATGVFGGLVQAGVGFVLLAGLTLAAGMALVPANVLKVVLVLLYAPLAIAVFWIGGKIDLVPGLVLGVAQAIGAWVGAGMALERGAKLIRAVTALVLVASALELLDVIDLRS